MKHSIKLSFLFLTVFISFTACSKEKNQKEMPVKKSERVSDEKKIIPCESKEDLLKKLEEKKKAEEEKGKGFSLQGGNTGCSIK